MIKMKIAGLIKIHQINFQVFLLKIEKKSKPCYILPSNSRLLKEKLTTLTVTFAQSLGFSSRHSITDFHSHSFCCSSFTRKSWREGRKDIVGARQGIELELNG